LDRENAKKEMHLSLLVTREKERLRKTHLVEKESLIRS